MAEQKTFDIEHYFALWQDDRLSRKEKSELQTWLDAAPENRQEWQTLTSLWQAADTVEIPQGRSSEQQWLRLQASLPKSGRPHSKALKNPFQRFAPPAILRSWRFALIAAVALLFALNPGHIFYGNSTYTVSAPIGKISKMRLADGSAVELNAGSSLTYPKKFQQEQRLVELAGEAFFHVAKSGAPFIVKTARAEIEVTGTSFNVRAWSESTAVFVKTGSVNVRPGSGQAAQTVSLLPGEMAICSADGSARKTIGSESLLVWRTGGLSFNAASLANALSELQRRFGKQVHADSGLLSEKITAQFQQESLSEIVSILAATLHAEVREVKDGYVLHQNK